MDFAKLSATTLFATQSWQAWCFLTSSLLILMLLASCLPHSLWTIEKRLYDLRLHLKILSAVLVARANLGRDIAETTCREDEQAYLQVMELDICRLTLDLDNLMQGHRLLGLLYKWHSAVLVQRELKEFYDKMLDIPIQNYLQSLETPSEAIASLLKDVLWTVSGLQEQLYHTGGLAEASQRPLSMLNGLTGLNNPASYSACLIPEPHQPARPKICDGKREARVGTRQVGVPAQPGFRLHKAIIANTSLVLKAAKPDHLERCADAAFRRLKLLKISAKTPSTSSNVTMRSTLVTTTQYVCSLETLFSTVDDPATMTALLEPIIASFQNLGRMLQPKEILRLSPANVDIIRHADSNILTARLPSTTAGWASRKRQHLRHYSLNLALDREHRARWRVGMIVLEVILCACRGFEALQTAREQFSFSRHGQLGQLTDALRRMDIIHHYLHHIGRLPDDVGPALLRFMGTASVGLQIDDILGVIRKSQMCVYLRYQRTWTVTRSSNITSSSPEKALYWLLTSIGSHGCILLLQQLWPKGHDLWRVDWMASHHSYSTNMDAALADKFFSRCILLSEILQPGHQLSIAIRSSRMLPTISVLTNASTTSIPLEPIARGPAANPLRVSTHGNLHGATSEHNNSASRIPTENNTYRQGPGLETGPLHPISTRSRTSQLYWCVPKGWAVSKLSFYSVIQLRDLDDAGLLRRLREDYNNMNGFFARWLSRKDWSGVEFIRFKVIDPDSRQICREKVALTCDDCKLPCQNYEYLVQEDDDGRSYCQCAAAEIWAGLNGELNRSGCDSLLDLLPGHLSTSALVENGKAWGPHAVEGVNTRYSCVRLAVMIAIAVVISLGFARYGLQLVMAVLGVLAALLAASFAWFQPSSTR
ncbi:hypothetical protein BDZ85DRAFT_77410 [Elsinoe ampelina]|uniref:Uncharacterized protein n=1 Tax=Elsinoe ampelina TaxID=302913 RepID=A0A6A6FYZ9_9PEZI|nr:hypothetical protein BDZ85DRAFT_77410 [Elsinoe ampelina]